MSSVKYQLNDQRGTRAFEMPHIDNTAIFLVLKDGPSGVRDLEGASEMHSLNFVPVGVCHRCKRFIPKDPRWSSQGPRQSLTRSSVLARIGQRAYRCSRRRGPSQSCRQPPLQRRRRRRPATRLRLLFHPLIHSYVSLRLAIRTGLE
jgi:hypothetical protein